MHWVSQYSEGLELFLQSHTVLAPLLLLIIEEMGIPIIVPGDAVVAYVGYGLSQHNSVSVWQALIVAMIATLIGSSVLFFASRRYGRFVIDRLGKYVFLKPKHIAAAEKLFKRYGVWTIIIGRHIPGLRVPITIFAATSGVRYRTFITCTFVSTGLWILFYLNVGKAIGANLQTIFKQDALITFLVVIGCILLIAVLHFIGERKRSSIQAKLLWETRNTIKKTKNYR
jgi:membrane protein DedA with SNARE-associated domain